MVNSMAIEHRDNPNLARELSTRQYTGLLQEACLTLRCAPFDAIAALSITYASIYTSEQAQLIEFQSKVLAEEYQLNSQVQRHGNAVTVRFSRRREAV
jgi:hypothetical protein